MQDGSAQEEIKEAAPVFPELYDEVQAYNASIYASGQEELKDAWSYEQPPFRLEKYGMSSELFGILTIPAMNVELGVYLGASKSNLSKGAAILGQTSIPTGQSNSNCVIAAHRGYSGKPMFREIQLLAVGDRLQLETLWDTQLWEVSEITVISPQDIEAIRIQKDKTMLTLITCHPYGQNHHRYVVFCTPVNENNENQTREELQIDQTNNNLSNKKEEQQEDVHVSGEEWGRAQRTLEKILLVAGIPLILLAVVLLLKQRRR